MTIYRRFAACSALALALVVTTISCAHKLAPGGAYSGSTITTNAAGTVTTNQLFQGDYAYYVVEAAFALAYDSMDAAFKFERDNRAALWKVSPSVKHTLDTLRPQADSVVVTYTAAREAYEANPVPVNLTAMQTALAKIQQLSAAAVAALPKQ